MIIGFLGSYFELLSSVRRGTRDSWIRPAIPCEQYNMLSKDDIVNILDECGEDVPV